MTDLLNLQDYCIFTFNSTSQALKGEKVMKQAAAHFVMMPTPREVSTSCGLAVKVNPVEAEKYYRLLVEHRVSIAGVFRLTRKGRKTEINNLEFS